MNGNLIYMVGASGAGKDSILKHCRSQLAERLDTCIAHRYITRAADAGAGAENHVALTSAEFHYRKQRGLFKFDWQANGLDYGIGREVDHWLARGLNVIVNGSRRFLPEARRLHPQLKAVYIDVDIDNLRQRLFSRGRESAAQIEQRLSRHQQIASEIADYSLRINNSGDLTIACGELLCFIEGSNTEI
jgi:ribose 1,5-bisphosphokinase